MNSSIPAEGQPEWHSKLSNVQTELELLELDADDDLIDAALDQYQQYLDQLDAARSDLDSLLTSTAATLDHLADISASFRQIDNETTAFQQQSVSVLVEQRQHEELARNIAENLQYYEPLDRITRRMNAPGAGNFVRSQDFRDMLVTLDECIDYMQTHPKHVEAELYRSRYKLLLTRALTLVRNTFMAEVRDVTTDVQKRIAEKQLNDTTMSALLYAKFRVEASSMKELGLEIQKRAMPAADADPNSEGEYQSLMNELHQSFASYRTRILLPLLQKKLADTAAAPSSKDLVQFARSSIGYIRGICLDEFELWGEWFHGQRGVYDFLETLCEPLYDVLRPRIIHENKLSKLCSLVTLLQTRYLGDDDEDTMPDLTQLDFATLVQPALEDAQTRLVFRTLAILREEIENYKPAADDLDYPRRTSVPPTPRSAAPLSGRRKSDLSIKTPIVVDEDSGDESMMWTRNRVLENCYPTLPKAVRLLSRIYRLVNSSIFDDLAHQIVHQTTTSLHNASLLISNKSSPADGQLFLLRHLLLLKSQIVAFDIEYVTPDVAFDFSGVTSTFYEIRERGGLFNPRSWMRLFSSGGLLPRVVENMLDAKVELDGRLREVISDFTSNFSRIMTSDLLALSSSIQNQKDNKNKPSKSKLEESALHTREMIENEIPILRAKLEQYLDDSRTRETLVAAVEDRVVQVYESFYDEYTSLSGRKVSSSGKISRKGKGPEEVIWDPDTFAEWAEGMFNVALPAQRDDEDGGDSPIGSRSLSRSGSS